MEICTVTPNLVEIRQKYRALYMKTEIRFTVAGDINTTQKHFCTTLNTLNIVISAT
jgi:hypothetical protein